MKKGIFFPAFILVVILVMAILFLFPKKINESEVIDSCTDGTRDNSCSSIKPYYCLNTTLIERASICECPEGLTKDDDKCFSEFHTNPKNITLNYIIDGEENKIDFIVYEGLTDYLSKIPRSISYDSDKQPSRADFKFKKINEENQRNFLLPLVVEIENLAVQKEDQMKIAVSIVQNIEWGYSNKTVRFADTRLSYSRYPYEILYDSQGLCGEKSELLAFLLRELGYDVVIFYNKKENHESVGIKCPLKYSWSGSGYCFIETSGPSIISDTSISYVGGIKITSNPQIINISNGFALGGKFEEYEDAETLSKIRGKVSDNGRINFFDKWRLDKLNEKYGLVDEYNAA